MNQETRGRLSMVQALIENFDTGGKGMSVADLIRLVTFERDLKSEQQGVSMVRATWVQPLPTEFLT